MQGIRFKKKKICNHSNPSSLPLKHSKNNIFYLVITTLITYSVSTLGYVWVNIEKVKSTWFHFSKKDYWNPELRTTWRERASPQGLHITSSEGLSAITQTWSNSCWVWWDIRTDRVADNHNVVWAFEILS